MSVEIVGVVGVSASDLGARNTSSPPPGRAVSRKSAHARSRRSPLGNASGDANRRHLAAVRGIATFFTSTLRSTALAARLVVTVTSVFENQRPVAPLHAAESVVTLDRSPFLVTLTNQKLCVEDRSREWTNFPASGRLALDIGAGEKLFCRSPESRYFCRRRKVFPECGSPTARVSRHPSSPISDHAKIFRPAIEDFCGDPSTAGKRSH